MLYIHSKYKNAKWSVSCIVNFQVIIMQLKSLQKYKITEEWTAINNNVPWDIFPINSLSMHCIIIKTFIEWNFKSREIDVHYLHRYNLYLKHNTRYMISLTLSSIHIIKSLLEKKNEQMSLMTSYNVYDWYM